MNSDRVDETIRKEFEAAWCAGTPCRISDVISDSTSAHMRATLEELVMIDMEFRWKTRLNYSSQQGAVETSSPISTETYVAQFPLLNDPEIVARLVQEEYHQRVRHGDLDDGMIDDYKARFPDIDFDELPLVRESKSQSAAPGQVLGRYQLLELHARGGFGEVWRAFDRVLNRVVAVKTIQARFRHDAPLRSRFESEARTTAKLEHPGIVSVHDMGEAAAQPFYAMRFLGGSTLFEAIRDFHQVPKPDSEWSVARMRLLSAFLAVCRAVEFAHSKGVIHRDLKPQNVALGEYGEISILDWGLAKQIDRNGRQQLEDGNSVQQPLAAASTDDSNDDAKHDDPLNTVEGSVVGTPAYMSPEQASGQLSDVDELSDQFCAGAILYEVLTGVPPKHRSIGQPLAGIVEPRELDRTIPAALNAICLKAMSPERDQRYASIRELIADFERYLSDEVVTAYDEPWNIRAARWIKRHRTAVAATVTGLLIATLVSAVALILLVDVNHDLAAKKKESEVLREQAEGALETSTENLYAHTVGLAYAEWSKNNVGRATELLQKCPLSLRDWEWHYLDSLIKQQAPQEEFRRHESPIQCIAFSHDGTHLATCGGTGTIVVKNVESQAELAPIVFEGTVEAICFSRDDQFLVIGGHHRHDKEYQGKFVVWNLTSGQVELERRAGGRAVFALTTDATGRLYSAGTDGIVDAWNPDTWDKEFELEAGEGYLRSLLAFRDEASSRQLLATCGDNRGIDVWDVVERRRIAVLTGHRKKTSQLVYDSQRNSLWSGGEDGLIKVSSLKQILPAIEEESTTSGDASIVEQPSEDSVPLIGHTDSVQCLALNRKFGLIASAGYDRTIRIWDLSSMQELHVLRYHTSHVRRLTFSPDGRELYSGGDEQTVYVWRVDQLTSDLPEGKMVAFAPNDDRLAVATDGQLMVRAVNGEQLSSASLGDRGNITSIDYSPGGDWVACSSRPDGISVMKCDDSGSLRHLDSDQQLVHHVRFTPDGQWVIGGCHDEKIRIWNVVDGIQREPIDTAGVVVSLAFSQQGKIVIGGFNDGQLAWWNFEDGTCRRRVKAHEKFLSCMATFKERDLLATSGIDGSIKVWRLSTGELLREMRLGASWLNCLAFTSDGQRLVSGSEQTVTFWDPHQGREIMSVALDRCVHNMSFNRRGDKLALAGESPQIRIWSLDSFSPEQEQ